MYPHWRPVGRELRAALHETSTGDTAGDSLILALREAAPSSGRSRNVGDTNSPSVGATPNQAGLERAIGDLGVQCGLIAHNREELEILKHKGDRNYYDVNLVKSALVPVSTVSLQLKFIDPIKKRFTIYVMADDKTIEKKDRAVGEALQFYTGRDHWLYELVIFSCDKNGIKGYLSTPKR